MWQPKHFYTLARLAKPGARVATYTVAVAVRQGLERAGFVCEKRMGYGSKRYSLAARFSGSAQRLACAVPRHVAVIGAGVAGSAVAHALAQRGGKELRGPRILAAFPAGFGLRGCGRTSHSQIGAGPVGQGRGLK